MLATLLIRRQFGQAVLGLKILGLGRANADGESWSGRLYAGLINPKRPTLGSTLAGKIEAVGKAVKQFKPGDQVYGTIASFGSHADYICLPEDGAITSKPATMSYEEAAAITPPLTALPFLRDNGQSTTKRHQIRNVEAKNA